MATTAVAPAEMAAAPTLFAFTRQRLAEEFAPRRQNSTDWYERSYRLRIHEHLGPLPVTAITADVVRAWCDQLIRREGDRQCAIDAFRTLQWILNEAMDEGIVSHNVTAAIKFRQRARSAVRQGAPSSADHAKTKPTLNWEQYGRLKDYAERVGLRDLVMVRLAVEGLLRRAELAGLRWTGFAPDGRTFEVAEGVTYTATTGTVTGELKTDLSHRAIVLSADLTRLLSHYRGSCAGGDARDFLFPGKPDKRAFDPSVPQIPNSITKHVCALIRRAGLVTPDGDHFTDLQGLRATGASLAAASGVPQAIIDAQMGHRGRTVFERHYRDVRTAPERFRFADLFEPETEPVKG